MSKEWGEQFSIFVLLALARWLSVNVVNEAKTKVVYIYICKSVCAATCINYTLLFAS